MARASPHPAQPRGPTTATWAGGAGGSGALGAAAAADDAPRRADTPERTAGRRTSSSRTRARSRASSISRTESRGVSGAPPAAGAPAHPAGTPRRTEGERPRAERWCPNRAPGHVGRPRPGGRPLGSRSIRGTHARRRPWRWGDLRRAVRGPTRRQCSRSTRSGSQPPPPSAPHWRRTPGRRGSGSAMERLGPGALELRTPVATPPGRSRRGGTSGEPRRGAGQGRSGPAGRR